MLRKITLLSSFSLFPYIVFAEENTSATHQAFPQNYPAQRQLDAKQKHYQQAQEKVLTPEDVERITSIKMKDKVSDTLLTKYQQNPTSLTPQEYQQLMYWVNEAAAWQPETAKNILKMDVTGPAIEYSNPELDKKYQAAHRIYSSLDYQFGKSTLEGLVVLGNSGNAIIKGVTTVETLARGISDKAFITALQAEKAMGKISPTLQWLEKHPIASETLIAGTVSTGFDVYNDKFTPEGAMMNYVLSGITAGKSLSKQLSINTIYQGIISANDNTKNDKEVLGDIMKKDISTIISIGTVDSVSKFGIVGNKVIVRSSIVGGIIENINVNPKTEEVKTKELE